MLIARSRTRSRRRVRPFIHHEAARPLSSDERGYTAARAVLCGITAGDTTTGALIGAGIGMLFVAF
jgi:hypothetical protein